SDWSSDVCSSDLWRSPATSPATFIRDTPITSCNYSELQSACCHELAITDLDAQRHAAVAGCDKLLKETWHRRNSTRYGFAGPVLRPETDQAGGTAILQHPRSGANSGRSLAHIVLE